MKFEPDTNMAKRKTMPSKLPQLLYDGGIWKLPPMDNCPAPRQLPHMKFPPGQLPPKFHRQDNSP